MAGNGDAPRIAALLEADGGRGLPRRGRRGRGRPGAGRGPGPAGVNIHQFGRKAETTKCASPSGRDRTAHCLSHQID